MHVVTRERPYCGTLCRMKILTDHVFFWWRNSEPDANEYPSIVGAAAMSVGAERFGGGVSGLISIWGVEFLTDRVGVLETVAGILSCLRPAARGEIAV